MYSILESKIDGVAIRFTFSDPCALRDGPWHHTALLYPMTSWLDELSVAEEASSAVRAIRSIAEESEILVISIDWLGLALLASERFRKTAGDLAADGSPPNKQKCAAARYLAEILCEVCHELHRVVYQATLGIGARSWRASVGKQKPDVA